MKPEGGSVGDILLLYFILDVLAVCAFPHIPSSDPKSSGWYTQFVINQVGMNTIRIRHVQKHNVFPDTKVEIILSGTVCKVLLLVSSCWWGIRLVGPRDLFYAFLNVLQIWSLFLVRGVLGCWRRVRGLGLLWTLL